MGHTHMMTCEGVASSLQAIPCEDVTSYVERRYSRVYAHTSCVHTHNYVYTPTMMCTKTESCVHTHNHVYKDIFTCTHTQSRVHTHNHVYTHTITCTHAQLCVQRHLMCTNTQSNRRTEIPPFPFPVFFYVFLFLFFFLRHCFSSTIRRK